MGCGTPAIVPQGGASDDFVNDENGYRVPSREIETHHEWTLCGPPLELHIESRDVKQAMRRAFESSSELHEKSRGASCQVHSNFTWERTVHLMRDRITSLVGSRKGGVQSDVPTKILKAHVKVCVCIIVQNHEHCVADCLAHIRPFTRDIVVIDGGCTDLSVDIAKEYDATVVSTLGESLRHIEQKGDWCLFIHGNEFVDPNTMERLAEGLAKLPLETKCANVHCVFEDEKVTANEMRLVRCDSSVFNTLYQLPVYSIGLALAEEIREPPVVDLSISTSHRNPLAVGKGRHGLHESWLIPYVPHSGDTFVDVGANVGTWSKCLSDQFRQVHAIEPHPDAVKVLRTELPENVQIHEWGAWNENKNVEFSKFEQAVHLSAYFVDQGIHTGPALGKVTIECRTVDSMDLVGQVDFIKCDVEGAAIEVLQGAQSIIQRDRPWLLVEAHSTENVRRLTTLLQEWSYLFTIIRDPNYKPFSELWHSHCWFSCQPSP